MRRRMWNRRCSKGGFQKGEIAEIYSYRSATMGSTLAARRAGM